MKLKKTDLGVEIVDDPSSCIHVLGIERWHKGGFKIEVSMSVNMKSTIGTRKLVVGYTKCKLYK